MAVPTSNYLIPYNYKSDLDTQAAGTLGIVLNDPTTANNKIYESAGAGVWNAVATPPSNIDMFGFNVPNLFGLGTTSELMIGSAVASTAGVAIPGGATISSVTSLTSITLSAVVSGSGSTTMTITNGGVAITGVTGTANGTATITGVTFPAPIVQPSAGLYAAIKAGEVHVLAHGIAKADSGTTDNAPMINWIAGILESRGGGKIIFDRPDVSGNYYGIGTPILLRNNVTFEGVDASVVIRNNSSTNNLGACFHGNGLSQSNYGYFTVLGLSSISAGDHTVTCASAPPFSIGQVILIFSKDGESPAGHIVSSIPAGGTNFIPYFSRQYRITNISGNVVTLDYPVTTAVTNPVICDGTGGHWATPNIPTKLIDRAVIRNLRLYADDASNGFSVDGGFYDGLIENIWVDKARHLINGNGYARVIMRGIRGFFSIKAFELATGSHDCFVHDVHGAWNGLDTLSSFILAGEYTANNEYADFNLFAPDASPSNAAVNVAQTTGLRVRDGYMRFNGVGINMQDKISISTSDIEFRNVIMNLSGQAVNFDCTPSSGAYTNYPTDIRLRNVKFTGAAPSIASMRFTQNCGIDFDDVDASTGVVQIGSGTPPTGRMCHVNIAGWSGSFADINKIDKRDMIRASGAAAYNATQNLLNVATAVGGITGTASNGSAIVTSMSSTSAIVVGDLVKTTAGTPTIPAGTTVVSVDSSSQVTLSNTMTGGGGTTLLFTHQTQISGITGTATNGSAVITGMSSTTGILAGDSVKATAGAPVIPGGTTVSSVDSSSQVTLSANVTTASGATTLQFTHVAFTVATFALAPGLVLTGRDQIIIEASGNVGSNTSIVKNILIADDAGTLLSAAVAAADTGAFVVRAVVTLESEAAGSPPPYAVTSIAGTITYPLGSVTATVSAEVRRTNVPSIVTNGRNFFLQAYAASQGPVITFNSINMYAKLYGE